MRYLLLLLIAFTFTNKISASTYTGDITLTNQSEVSSYQSNYGYDTIIGQLFISGSDVNNLAGISNIKFISEQLAISSTIITNLSLPNLKFCGNLTLHYCNNLNSISNLNSNLQIEGLNIQNCNVLTNLSALNVLDTLKSLIFHILPLTTSQLSPVLNIVVTDQLALVGLNNLITVPNFNKTKNIKILDLENLNALKFINYDSLKVVSDHLFINNCNVLDSITGFPNLSKINYLSILSNPLLKKITGFKKCKTIPDLLLIKGSPLLTNVSGLYNVKLFGAIQIINNTSLNTCCFIADAHRQNRIQSYVSLENNASLCSDFLSLIETHCIDNDFDFISNQDNCNIKYNPDQTDSDYDGIGDVCDNCPFIANFDQLDNNQDGIGNVCQDTNTVRTVKSNSDIYISDSRRGIIIQSPNGLCYRVSVDVKGKVFTTVVTCPN